MHFVNLFDIHNSTKHIGQPLTEVQIEIQCFKHSDAIKICDEIIFNFYVGLSHKLFVWVKGYNVDDPLRLGGGCAFCYHHCATGVCSNWNALVATAEKMNKLSLQMKMALFNTAPFSITKGIDIHAGGVQSYVETGQQPEAYLICKM